MTKKKSTHPSTKEERLFNNLSKITTEFICGSHFTPLTTQALIERLHIHPDNLAVFKKVILSLKKEGKLTLVGKYYHRTKDEKEKKKENVIRGAISVHPRGFGFVNRPDPDKDIFIPKPLMNGAIDGDIVEVLVSPEQPFGKGPEGKVTAVVERKRKQLVGTVVFASAKKAEVFSTLLGELHPAECSLRKGETLKNGDRVILDVLSWGQKKEPTKCKLARILGSVQDAASDIPFAIAENDIKEAFPQACLLEAQQFGQRVKTSDLAERTDLRHLECFTIDPDTAKDFDDAISVECIGSSYRLGVHIADVSHYVRAGGALDEEARLRCNSTYFPNTCIPMLPRELSEHLCSLRPNVNRLTVSVFITIDENGETKDWEIVRSVIKSRKRFTYKEVKAVLDGTAKSPYTPSLLRMVALCQLLKRQRSERGSVQLYVPEAVVKVNETGEPTGMEIVEYDITHQMVEEFMLKANEVVAIQIGKMGRDVSYRVHEEPADESLQEFATLVSAFGFSLPRLPKPRDIQQLFLEAQNSPHATYLATCYIKSMRLACYSPDNIGHYGLSLQHYCHFTSPIRRYIDVIIHRLLLEKGLDKEILSDLCLSASDKERVSARAEGSVRTLKKLRLLSKTKAQAPKKEYEAIITRVKPFGIYFDIVDLMLEGFLHVSELEDDYFHFNETNSSLVGEYEGSTYRSGHRIKVSCISVDLIAQEAKWRLLQCL